jgi:hypothetical protein
MSQLSTARLKQLTRLILTDPDPNARLEALLEIRQSDHPKVIELLQEVNRTDREKSVRDLAANLLTKKKIEAMDAPANPVKVDGWTCRSCGGQNPRPSATCTFCRAEQTGSGLSAEQATTRSPSPLTDPAVFIIDREHVKRFQRGGRGFGAQGCLTLFLIPFVLIGLFMVGFLLNSLREQVALDQRGMEIAGRVSDKTISSGDSDSYYVHFQFEAEGRTWTDRVSLAEDIYDRTEVGQPVEVRYVQGDPAISVLVGVPTSAEIPFLFVFSVCWNGFAWTMFIGSIVHSLKQRRLYQEGRVITGEVLAAKGERDSDGDFFLELEYGFAAPGTRDFLTGKYRGMHNHLKGKALPERRTPLAILYRAADHHQPL